MEDWFPCWASGLQLLPSVEGGWSPAGRKKGTGGEQQHDCWWKPPLATSCEAYYASVREASANGTTASSAAGGRTSAATAGVRRAVRHDVHDTGAGDRWRAFYDQELADAVYKLYRADFEGLGYERLQLP